MKDATALVPAGSKLPVRGILVSSCDPREIVDDEVLGQYLVVDADQITNDDIDRIMGALMSFLTGAHLEIEPFETEDGDEGEDFGAELIDDETEPQF